MVYRLFPVRDGHWNGGWNDTDVVLYESEEVREMKTVYLCLDCFQLIKEFRNETKEVITGYITVQATSRVAMTVPNTKNIPTGRVYCPECQYIKNDTNYKTVILPKNNRKEINKLLKNSLKKSQKWIILRDNGVDIIGFTIEQINRFIEGCIKNNI